MKKEKKFNELIEPFKSEFRKRDILQIIIGASILSVPVGFTQETWDLGGTLPLLNILILIMITLVFISFFTYFHYHRHHVNNNKLHHIKHFSIRVLMTYVISFVIVGILLSIIQVAPWHSDFLLAFKRTAIVTFPSSMSAVVADVIR
jgi:uncharacterized membrane protein